MIYDEIPARPEPQRDRYGRYLIDGKPRTRVTTFAGAIADKASLIPWAQARAVRGVVERPDLLAAAAAAMDDERALRKVCEEAKEVGGATAAATLGTALHRMTELADLGLPTPELHADRVGEYRACLAAHGVEILPEWVETVLLVDRFDIAGTCDRIVMWDGRPTILDLKTGKSLDFGLGEYSIQLALYANADHAWDVAKGERLELPEIRRDVALIAHLPAQGTGCELVAVDIEAGWAAAELAEGVRAWRKRRDLGRKIVAGAGEQPPTPDGTSGAVVEAVETPAPARAGRVIGSVRPLTKPDAAPTWERPDEGELLDATDIRRKIAQGVDTWAAKVGTTPDELSARLSVWRTQARDAGRPIHVHADGLPTERRFGIYRAAVRLAALTVDDDDARDVIAECCPELGEMQPAMTVGMALGTLSRTQAAVIVGHLDAVAVRAVA